MHRQLVMRGWEGGRGGTSARGSVKGEPASLDEGLSMEGQGKQGGKQ